MIESGRILIPRAANIRDDVVGNTKTEEKIIIDDVLARSHQQAIELGRRGFQQIDFSRSEAITGGFVPIRAAIRGVPDEAALFDNTLPAGAWLDYEALHYSPEPSPPPSV